MKRLELLKHVLAHGCVVLREGGNHTALFNPANRKQTVLGRHREIDDLMARVICRQLEIPAVK